MLGNLGETAGEMPISSANAVPRGQSARSTAPVPFRRRVWRTLICGALVGLDCSRQDVSLRRTLYVHHIALTPQPRMIFQPRVNVNPALKSEAGIAIGLAITFC